jgi:serine/threonine protein kinase
MGVVYKARQLKLNRIVALKMILAGVHASTEQLARFRAEAHAAAQLRHPQIIQIHDIGEHDGLPYFVIEYIDGGSLADLLSSGPQHPDVAASLVESLARAMHIAHRQGLVHRDLKPANILLSRHDTATHDEAAKAADDRREGLDLSRFLPKISDFGLAKRLDGQAGLTASEDVIGTPSYMAPEQAWGRNEEVGPRTDVYSLGAILYETLTGRPVFKGVTSWDTIEQVRSEEPVPPRRLQPKLDRELETICLKCLNKEPARRYADAESLAEDLRRYRNREPILARPVTWWERGLEWTRRRPSVAALLVVSCLAALLTTGLIVGWWFDQQTRLALDQAKRSHYFRCITVADRDLALHNTGNARRLLDECPPELRHWEWHYLDRLCRARDARLAFPGNTTVAFGPDGKTVAVVDKDQAFVVVRDVESGKVEKRFGPHIGAVVARGK